MIIGTECHWSLMEIQCLSCIQETGQQHNLVEEEEKRKGNLGRMFAGDQLSDSD